MSLLRDLRVSTPKTARRPQRKDGSCMPQLMCCNHMQKCRLFYLKPGENYRLALVYWLEECSICGHSVLYMRRIDYNNNYSSFRKTNEKARKLFGKLESAIDFEYRMPSVPAFGSGFYLHYNDCGTVRRCYSNFSTLQMGRFAGIGEPLPEDNSLRL